MEISVAATPRTHAAARVRYVPLLVGLAITLLAAGLRLVQIGENGYSLDEAFSLWFAQHSAPDIVRTILIDHWDASPPAYYLLLHLFMGFGSDPLTVRALSIIAGALTVAITFRLALYLFDMRVAVVSSLLLAMAPLHIEYSQVARAYMLAALFALLSIYLFAEIVFGRPRATLWVVFVGVTCLALYAHYLIILLVLFENGWIGALWLRRQLGPGMLKGWLISQGVLGLLLLPLSLSVVFSAGSDSGQGWLARPGLTALVKTTILFVSGDPSYGDARVTLARGLSLAVVVAIAALAVRLFLARRQVTAPTRREAPRAAFLAAAVGIPWGLAFVVSQARPIYHEKYLLFVLPPLLILVAWILLRSRPRPLAWLVGIALICMTGRALLVYYSAPAGEQWREAAAWLRPTWQASDLVIIAPGFYGRPLAYYLYGDFRDYARTLSHTPAVILADGHFRALTFTPGSGDAGVLDAGLRAAPRVWLVEGSAPVDPRVPAWIAQHFRPLETTKLVGAQATLWQRPAR